MSINNKNLNLSIKTLAVLAISAFLVMPMTAKGSLDGYVNAYTPPTNTTSDFNNASTNSNTTTNTNTITSPVINSITPNQIQRGNGVPAIAISGKNFNTTSIARWNGSERITNYVDSNHLVMQLYASDIVSKTHTVTVLNRSTGTVSNGVSFVVKPMASEIMTTMVKKTPSTTTTNSAPITNYPENSENTASSIAANAVYGSSGFFPTGLIQWILIALLVLVGVILWRKLARQEYESTPLKHA